MRLSIYTALVIAGLAAACTARTSSPSEPPSPSGPSGASGPTNPGAMPPVPAGIDPLTRPEALGRIEARRLSRAEIRRTIAAALTVDVSPYLDALPEDEHTPFDNDSDTQYVSSALVEGARALAKETVDDLSDADLQNLIGCDTTATACRQLGIERLGRRLLRRQLGSDEVAAYLALADSADDLRVAIRAMLQDLEFLYRVEIGGVTAEPGLIRLNDFEVATRLSFLIWGSGPDDELLDLAESGQLRSAGQLRVQVARMLEDSRAADQMAEIHAMWLGYDRMPVMSALRDDLRQESDQLVRRVLFEEGQPWSALFNYDQTYVTPDLASHYGLPRPASAGWVRYPDNRRGLLSHGSFLSGGNKFGEASPTQRGLLVYERLACLEIPPPPPDVMTDVIPAGGPDDCMKQRWHMSKTPGCDYCHRHMDTIGFGLDQFGPEGQFLLSEIGRPNCALEGQGNLLLTRQDSSLLDLGAFSGPTELAQKLVDEGIVQRCFTRQFFQYAIGRHLEADDMANLSVVADRFAESGDLLDLILDMATSESFRHRKLEN